MVKAMDMPVHNIHGFCHASMGNVMAWQNSYYMTFVMLYEFCHTAWVLPYNPLFDPWHAVGGLHGSQQLLPDMELDMVADMVADKKVHQIGLGRSAT